MENEVTPRGRPIAVALDDLLMMFLTRARLGTPYYPLALQFQVSNGAAQRNINRVRDVINGSVGKRLFHLQHASAVKKHLPEDWPERFENTLLIGDGYPKSIRRSGVFVVQRITWSSYKHGNIFLIVLCELLHLLVILAVFDVLPTVVSPDGLIQMRSFTYGGQSAEVTTIINESGILAAIRG